MEQTNQIPVDDFALDAIEASLSYYLERDYSEDADPSFPFKGAGAPYSLSTLLDFYSGVSEDDNVFEGYIRDIPLYYNDTPHFTERDVIQALIDEVRRLRHEQD